MHTGLQSVVFENKLRLYARNMYSRLLINIIVATIVIMSRTFLIDC